MLWKMAFILVLLLLVLSYDVGRGKPEIFSNPEVQAFRTRMLDTVDRLRVELQSASEPGVRAARSHLRDAAQGIRNDLKNLLPRHTHVSAQEAASQSR